MNFKQDLDRSIIPQIERFWTKVNERTLHAMGVPGYETYDTGGDEALGSDVEYFHFSICADSRMRYIGENLVLNDDPALDEDNKLCNAVITHLYGGRRINTIFSGRTDPKKAFLDFRRLHVDAGYVQDVVGNAAYAKSHHYKFYGTTELHTSLQTAARNYCRSKYSEPTRAATNTDILEWVASWISDGTVARLKRARDLENAFAVICSLPGIGSYYGYHLGVDSSLFPFTAFNHDEKFCVPGGGCQVTLAQLFPSISKHKSAYGEAVVWIEENQKDLFPNLTFHPALWNIEAGGKKVFPFEQNKLMVYGLEVGLCQFGVYQHLKKNPHLIERRKVGQDPDLTPIAEREKGNPLSPVQKVKKSDTIKPQTNLLEF